MSCSKVIRYALSILSQGCIALCFLMQNTLAVGCSVDDDNWGEATINEVFSGLGGRTAFIEIKILEPVDTTNWRVNICKGLDDCNNFLVSDMTDSHPWHYRENNNLNDFVDFKNGFDVSLIDASGNFIDYITIHNKSYQPKNGCVVEDLPFWNDTPSDVKNGTKFIHRTEDDGTGAWVKNQPNGDGTKGSSNDGITVDHYEIIHDAIGSTCDIESITINACANSDCSLLSTDEITLDFQADGTTLSTPTFTGSSTLSFVHTIDETLTLSVANPSITPDNVLICKDGSGASCDIVFSSENCNPFAAWWQFENDFLDSSSSDTHNLIPINSPLFGESDPGPANTIGIESTCRYVSFDGSNYATINDSGDFNFPDLSVSTWVNPTSYPSSGLRSLVSKDEHFEFHINSSGKLYWWWRTPGGTSHTLTSETAIPIDTWTHVAVVYDSAGGQYMYINGVLAKSASYTDGLADSPCDFYIGTDVGTGSSTTCGSVLSGRNFQGHMDEVHIYDYVLSASEIQDDMNVVHSCSLFGVDHYQIEHDGNGLTCAAENITIKACADAACSALINDATDVELSINGTLDKTVTVSDGSTETSFSYTDSVLPATLSLDQDYECKNGASDSCDVVFADTGFRFFAGAESNPIPTQISAKPSAILSVQAIDKNADTGACQAVFIDTTEIDMAATCVDPIECAGSQVAIDALSTETTLDTLNIGALLTYKSVELNFGDDTKNAAEFVFTYPDAGKMQLHARYNIPDENGDPSGNYMLGSSDHFVVRPFGFYINVNGNPKAQDATGSKFIAAGKDFITTLTAVQWQADDDTDLSDNSVTNNFGNEEDAESAIINYELYRPDPGIEGTLMNINFTDFSDGAATNNNMTYSEVGIVSFTATLTDNSYIDVDDVTGSEPYVGRFIPHHFALSSSFVGNSCGDATYMDELAIELTYEIKARNSTNDVTQNYTGDFAKSSVVLVAENSDNGIDLVPARLTGYAGSWANGIYINEEDEVSDIDLVTFIRNPTPEVDGPFDNLLFGVKLTGAEGAALIELTMRSDTTGVCTTNVDPATDCSAKLLSSTESKIRFGRWIIENTFGPETSDLPVPMAIQYYDGSNFVTNTLDNCTTLGAVNLSVDDSGLSGGTSTESGSGTFANGVSNDIELSAPGAGNTGNVELQYLDPSVPSWLLYDWDGDNSFDDFPSATATFGLFRGNDRIIYQREVH